MTALKLNREFLVRHLFALAVFAVLGGWFGFDAFVRYPRTPAAALYESIEKAPPPAEMGQAKLDAFKAQKTKTQYVLAVVTLNAALLVAIHLLVVAGFKFAYDDDGFVLQGKRFAWGDVRNVDESKWEKKSVLRISGDGWSATLDAWHHAGVKEFRERLKTARAS